MSLDVTDEDVLQEESKRLLILHGEPGTGKSTLAKIIQQETDSELMSMNGSSIVYAMQGSWCLKKLF